MKMIIRTNAEAASQISNTESGIRNRNKSHKSVSRRGIGSELDHHESVCWRCGYSNSIQARPAGIDWRNWTPGCSFHDTEAEWFSFRHFSHKPSMRHPQHIISDRLTDL